MLRFVNRARAVALFAVCGLASAAQLPAASADEGMDRLLQVLEDRGSISKKEREEIQKASKEAPPTPAPVAAEKPKAEASPKPLAWYERLGIRGYVQTRHHEILSKDGADLDVPADRSVSENDTFLIRRGRLILSGDVHDHLYLYVQPDMMASPSSGDFSVQMRDLYADIAVDKAKEFRFRVGQSKVPFGWVNMQSSQNRLAVERPDALNSAVEGERDIGIFFYWAPAKIRDRFRSLVSSGLKGSGDYGVFGLGAYSGQGLNRRDLNGVPHTVARVSYPFQLDNGQFFEVGVNGYFGHFVTRTEPYTINGTTVTPKQKPDGAADRRIGATFVWYPQPFGIEAEWNIGEGPELSRSANRISAHRLHGGYLQGSYRIQNLAAAGYKLGEATPFLRWHYYNGGRKFGRNAAPELVNEFDLGIEWQPLPVVELALSYTPTIKRTNTSSQPFENSIDAHRIGMQLQINY